MHNSFIICKRQVIWCSLDIFQSFEISSFSVSKWNPYSTDLVVEGVHQQNWTTMPLTVKYPQT